MSSRVEAVRACLPGLGASALLVTHGVNVRYLTGFQSSNAWLLVDAERVLLLTDGRYADAARGVPGVEAVQAERDLAADLGARLGRLVSGPVAFEAEHLTVSHHAAVAASGVELLPSTGAVERLREVKDAGELDSIREAAAILTRAYELLRDERITGRTEADVAWWMERTLRELGADGIAFDAIVASGPNAAHPHHHPGAREIGRGETVVVDAGCVVGGYCSDCTRTFATGPLPDELALAYEVCREAQAASLAAVREGAACADVDAIARTALERAGYDVLHNLGHSVGLEIHESPRLGKSVAGAVASGNVLTVEPGVYLPGLGGVRIEDLVVATDEAPEVLTPLTTELVTLA